MFRDKVKSAHCRRDLNPSASFLNDIIEGASTLCAFVILLPVLGLALFWLLPLPTAIAVYAVVLVISVWVFRSVRKSIANLWNKPGKQ